MLASLLQALKIGTFLLGAEQVTNAPDHYITHKYITACVTYHCKQRQPSPRTDIPMARVSSQSSPRKELPLSMTARDRGVDRLPWV